MKTKIMTLLLLVLATAIKAQNAQFVVNDFNIEPGETVEVEVAAKNSVDIIGFQLTVTLPNGLSFVSYGDEYGQLASGRRHSTHILTSGDTPKNNALTFAAFSMQNKAFSGKSGAIMTFKVQAASSISAGSYKIKFSNMTFSDANSSSIDNADFEVTATVVDPIAEEVRKFKADYATILAKTTSNVTENDLTAINNALSAYSKLSANAQNQLKTEKAKLDELKTEAELKKEVNKFKADHAAILAKTTSNVTENDLAAINNALSAYSKLSAKAQNRLDAEKKKLDALKTAAEKDKENNETDKALQAEINKFRTDHAAILAKTTSNVTENDLTAINNALSAYSKLSANAQEQLKAEKTKLDSLKTAIDVLQAEIKKFKNDHAAILAKTTSNVTENDLAAINNALSDYNKLSEKAKKALQAEKDKLDKLKAAAEKDKENNDADKALQAEINKFRTDHATILAKTTSNVTENDLTAINNALTAYSKLSAKAKTQLQAEKTKLDELKTEAELKKEINKFKSDHAAILAKTTSNVTKNDLAAIDKALANYNKLSEKAKARLAAEKKKLDELKDAIPQDNQTDLMMVIIDGEEVGLVLYTGNSIDLNGKKFWVQCNSLRNKLNVTFKGDVAAFLCDKYGNRKYQIGVKTIDTDKYVPGSRYTAFYIQCTITSDMNVEYGDRICVFSRLNGYDWVYVDCEDASKAYITIPEDLIALQAEINKFKSDHAAILAKTISNVTENDLTAINNALSDYNKLSEKAKKALEAEKAKLDDLKAAAEKEDNWGDLPTENICIDGIYYNFDVEKSCAEVTKHPEKYSGSVTIPESVTYGGRTFAVTAVGKEAFSWCSKLTSVVIPNSVTAIGNYAFEYCESLTSVEIPKSVTAIGGGAFSWCLKLTSVEIPNSVTAIGFDTFAFCESLTSVEIPNSVTSIGHYAFSYCSSLTSVVIPNSVTVIGVMAFYGCADLTSVVIPNSVTAIGGGAFCGSDLTSVEIPNSVTSIREQTFWCCYKLTSVVIPNSVTAIGNNAFANCTNLTTVNCEAIVPPTLDKDAFEGIPLSSATLYVPQAALNDYKKAEQWKDFGQILPMNDKTGIVGADMEDVGQQSTIFTLDGRQVDADRKSLSPGIYIVNGKKVIIR